VSRLLDIVLDEEQIKRSSKISLPDEDDDF
jgi:hypothetical protein